MSICLIILELTLSEIGGDELIHVIPKRANNQLWPYAFMVHYGYAALRDYVASKHGGTYMLFTPLGKLYLQKRIAQRLAVTSMSADVPKPNNC